MTKLYQFIQSYLDQFKQLNPGSISLMERDNADRSKRAMVCVMVVADSINFNQRVLGIDCSHSKCPWYDGRQMTLVGQDENRETAVIAFALVPSEDLPNYAWFFKHLLDAGYSLTGSVMFCDRDAAMLPVANTLGIHIRFCTLHIIRNVSGRFKHFTSDHHNMVWKHQAADTEEAYKSQLGCIELELGVRVRKYLEEIPPLKWCVHPNIGLWPLYGWRTSNFVESQFGSQVAMGFREMPPLQFIQAMCGRILDRAYRRHTNCVE